MDDLTQDAINQAYQHNIEKLFDGLVSAYTQTT
jgi:hypothetical protein